MNLIKLKVGQRVIVKKEKYYEQPEELQKVMEDVKRLFAEVGAVLENSEPLSYGRKIRATGGKVWAEINIFYGHRGVSVVGTSKTGSNKELCGTLVELLKNHFQTLQNG